jgi:hypothetical protein
MLSAIECPACSYEFYLEIPDDEFDYTPEQKRVNHPNERACEHIPEDATYNGPDVTICPKCKSVVELDKTKLENEYLEALHD